MSAQIIVPSIISNNPLIGDQRAFKRVFELSDALVDHGFGADALQHACDLLDVDVATARAALDSIDFAAAYRS